MNHIFLLTRPRARAFYYDTRARMQSGTFQRYLFLYPEEGSIGQTSVKTLKITASILQFKLTLQGVSSPRWFHYFAIPNRWSYWSSFRVPDILFYQV